MTETASIWLIIVAASVVVLMLAVAFLVFMEIFR